MASDTGENDLTRFQQLSNCLSQAEAANNEGKITKAHNDLFVWLDMKKRQAINKISKISPSDKLDIVDGVIEVDGLPKPSLN